MMEGGGVQFSFMDFYNSEEWKKEQNEELGCWKGCNKEEEEGGCMCVCKTLLLHLASVNVSSYNVYCRDTDCQSSFFPTAPCMRFALLSFFFADNKAVVCKIKSEHDYVILQILEMETFS